MENKVGMECASSNEVELSRYNIYELLAQCLEYCWHLRIILAQIWTSGYNLIISKSFWRSEGSHHRSVSEITLGNLMDLYGRQGLSSGHPCARQILYPLYYLSVHNFQILTSLPRAHSINKTVKSKYFT